MSKEESKNRLEKTRYIRQTMGQSQNFKPNADCLGRFLRFCDSKAEIVVDEFYGTMCAKCMMEAKRIHKAALEAPAKPVKNWGSDFSGIHGQERCKYGSSGYTKTLKRSGKYKKGEE